MSLELIQNEIRRFLSTAEPEVICISGHWGVGKTFAWNRFLRDAQAQKGIALKRYSYVSLFGVNSLEEFKYSIFENSVKSSEIGTEPSLETLQSNTAAAAERFGRKSLWFVQQIPLVRNYVGGLGPVWFLSVKNTVVCIDDVERRGKGLDVRDIMGLASNLKEHKGCKVVLILNDDALEQDKKEFDTYYEKVVDSTLKFAPTPEESARIALTGQSEAEQLLSTHCMTLGISNIRLIKKIERAVRKIEPMLKPYDPEIFKQAIHSLALFGWSLYEPNKAPSVEYLKGHNSAQYFLEKKKGNIPEKEAAWNALLGAYSFSSMDEFDLVLLQGMRDGYFDAKAVEKHAAELDRTSEAARLNNSFTEAWNLFHDSFENNERDVVDAITASFRKNVRNISLTNLNGTVSLLKDLGRDSQASEIIQYYVENHGSEKRAFDLDNFAFRDSVTDPGVISAVSQKFASFADNRNPTETLLGITNGWSPQDMTFLSGLRTEDYYAIFKKSTGDKLRKLISNSLQFDAIGNASEPMKEISRKAKEALKRIGQESRINARRVAKYGIHIEDTPSTGTDGQTI